MVIKMYSSSSLPEDSCKSRWENKILRSCIGSFLGPKKQFALPILRNNRVRVNEEKVSCKNAFAVSTDDGTRTPFSLHTHAIDSDIAVPILYLYCLLIISRIITLRRRLWARLGIC